VYVNKNAHSLTTQQYSETLSRPK